MTELDVIKKKIRERLNDLADLLADGGASDYSEYKYLTGQIYGIALIERDIIDLRAAQETED